MINRHADSNIIVDKRISYIRMAFVETSLMRQLGKLVEIVRHANEILGDG